MKISSSLNKYIGFLFLGIVLITLFSAAPQIVHAKEYESTWDCVTDWDCESLIAVWLTGDDQPGGFFIGLIRGFSNLLIYVSESFFNISANFLSYVLSPSFTGKPLVGNQAFDQTWANVRDLTNMLIVLAFVFVGIAVTLRLKNYEATKLLPRIILVAIFINFSGLICNEIYNTSNIVQNAFLKNGGSGSIPILKAKLNRAVNENLASAKKTQASKDYLVLLGASAATFIILGFGGFVFLILGILLAARYGVLVVLYILSPLAMFCFIFGKLEQHWKDWWDRFIQWSFLGAIAGFLIYLAATALPADPSTSEYLISFVFLYLAYSFARKGSAKGSAAIMGLAGAAVGYATGGMSKLAKPLGSAALGVASKAGGAAVGGIDQATGGKISQYGTATKGRLGRAMEAIGLRPMGSQNAADTQRVNAYSKSMEAAYKSGNGGDKNRIKALAQRGRGAQGAAAIKIVAESGDLHDTFKGDINAIKTRVQYGTAFGAGNLQKSAIENDYRMAALDDKKVNELVTTRGLTVADARAQVVITQLKEALPSMKGKQLRGIDSSHIGAAAGYEAAREFSPSMVKQLQTADPAIRSGMMTHVSSGRIDQDITDANAAGDTNEVKRLRSLKNAINKYCV